MKLLLSSALILVAAAMCLVARSHPQSSAEKYSWMIDRKTHKLKQVSAGRGVPTYTHVGFPIEQTTNYAKHPDHGVPGCGPGYDPTLRQHMIATPTSITTTVGTDVTLRYDASEICQGQGFKNAQGVLSPDPRAPDNPNFNIGTADWQVGEIQSLPREWGIITLPGGYAQAGTYTITIKVMATCVDAGKPCEHTWGTTVSVPVTVN
jgi:hypothetical protein